MQYNSKEYKKHPSRQAIAQTVLSLSLEREASTNNHKKTSFPAGPISKAKTETMTELARVNEDEQESREPIPVAKMIEYRQQGLTYKEIGTILNCSRENVIQRLRPYREALNGLEAYKARKSDVIHLKASMLLDSVTPDKIKDMSAYQAIGSFGILYDKGNLEDGKPTALVAYADLCKGADDVDARLAKLEGRDK